MNDNLDLPKSKDENEQNFVPNTQTSPIEKTVTPTETPEMPMENSVPIESLTPTETPVVPESIEPQVPPKTIEVTQSALDMADLKPQNNLFNKEPEQSPMENQTLTETPMENPGPVVSPVATPPVNNNLSLETPVETAAPITNEDAFKATSTPVITKEQINANNLEPVELNKKIVIENTPAEAKPKKKGNMFVGFLCVLVILGALGYGVYYLANNGVLNIPYITKTTTTTTTTTKTTTTTTAVKDINGTYKATNTNCPTTPMNLAMVQDGTFTLSIVDDTCAATNFSGTYIYDKTTNNVTYTNSDNSTFSAKYTDGKIDISFNNTTYSFIQG